MSKLENFILAHHFTKALRYKNMEITDYKITGVTIAVNHMDDMLSFYTNVFGINFSKKEMYGTVLYSGIWANLEVLFCPAAIAQNRATQNKHQFDIIVEDLQKIVDLVIQHKGQLMSDITDDGHTKSVGIYDPDKNSMVLKQLL